MLRKFLLFALTALILGSALGLSSASAASGAVQWVRRSARAEQDGATHMVVRNGAVYVLGSWSSFAYPYPSSVYLFKYNTSGGTLWSQSYGQQGSSSTPKGLAVDAKGNAFILAHYNEPTGQLGSYLVLKFAARTGRVEWARTIRRPDDASWSEEAITVDAAGNAYVAGSSLNKTIDYLVVSYSPTGKLRWIRKYDGPAKGGDRAQSVAAGTDGIYVAGFSWGGATSDDWAVVKYGFTGRQVWARRLDAGYRVAKVVVDALGHVVVVGTAGGININGKYTNDDYFVARYRSNGQFGWSRRYNGPAFGNDRPADVTTDRNGNVYVTGWGGDAAGFGDYLTVSFDSAGGLRWAKRFAGPGNSGNSDDAAKGVVVSDTGDVYVTGKAFSGPAPRGYDDYYTVKYGPTGRQEWARLYNRVPQQNDAAAAIGIDATGVYVAGTAAQDITTLKYTR